MQEIVEGRDLDLVSGGVGRVWRVADPQGCANNAHAGLAAGAMAGGTFGALWGPPGALLGAMIGGGIGLYAALTSSTACTVVRNEK